MHGHVLLFLCGCWGFTPSFPHSKSKHSYPMRHLPSLCPALLNAVAGCYEFLFLDSLPNDRTPKLRSQLLLCVESLNFDLYLSNQAQASRSLCRSPQLEDTDTSIAGIDGMGIGRLVVAINFFFLRPFLRFWTSLGDCELLLILWSVGPLYPLETSLTMPLGWPQLKLLLAGPPQGLRFQVCTCTTGPPHPLSRQLIHIGLVQVSCP